MIARRGDFDDRARSTNHDSGTRRVSALVSFHPQDPVPLTRKVYDQTWKAGRRVARMQRRRPLRLRQPSVAGPAASATAGTGRPAGAGGKHGSRHICISSSSRSAAGAHPGDRVLVTSVWRPPPATWGLPAQSTRERHEQVRSITLLAVMSSAMQPDRLPDRRRPDVHEHQRHRRPPSMTRCGRKPSPSPAPSTATAGAPGGATPSDARA